jgi:hypothetical protein
VKDPNHDRVTVTPLVTRFHEPVPSSPRTRDKVPRGYGVREQCLPFTAAAGIGLSVPSPITWGYCARSDVPAGARAFRSPVQGSDPDRCFYVRDDLAFDFERNQFLVPPDIRKRIGPGPIPGLSFFDRNDQQDMVKLHLPYVWRTPPGTDLLFTQPINRARADGLLVLTGLVECDWYTDAVNLVLKLPAAPGSVHVVAGDIVAQVLALQRNMRQLELEVLPGHSRTARDIASGVSEWRDRHDTDRAAYKRLSRSRIGAIPEESG